MNTIKKKIILEDKNHPQNGVDHIKSVLDSLPALNGAMPVDQLPVDFLRSLIRAIYPVDDPGAFLVLSNEISKIWISAYLEHKESQKQESACAIFSHYIKLIKELDNEMLISSLSRTDNTVINKLFVAARSTRNQDAPKIFAFQVFMSTIILYSYNKNSSYYDKSLYKETIASLNAIERGFLADLHNNTFQEEYLPYLSFILAIRTFGRFKNLAISDSPFLKAIAEWNFSDNTPTAIFNIEDKAQLTVIFSSFIIYLQRTNGFENIPMLASNFSDIFFNDSSLGYQKSFFDNNPFQLGQAMNSNQSFLDLFDITSKLRYFIAFNSLYRVIVGRNKYLETFSAEKYASFFLVEIDNIANILNNTIDDAKAYSLILQNLDKKVGGLNIIEAIFAELSKITDTKKQKIATYMASLLPKKPKQYIPFDANLRAQEFKINGSIAYYILSQIFLSLVQYGVLMADHYNVHQPQINRPDFDTRALMQSILGKNGNVPIALAQYPWACEPLKYLHALGVTDTNIQTFLKRLHTQQNSPCSLINLPLLIAFPGLHTNPDFIEQEPLLLLRELSTQYSQDSVSLVKIFAAFDQTGQVAPEDLKHIIEDSFRSLLAANINNPEQFAEIVIGFSGFQSVKIVTLFTDNKVKRIINKNDKAITKDGLSPKETALIVLLRQIQDNTEIPFYLSIYIAKDLLNKKHFPDNIILLHKVHAKTIFSELDFLIRIQEKVDTALRATPSNKNELFYNLYFGTTDFSRLLDSYADKLRAHFDYYAKLLQTQDIDTEPLIALIRLQRVMPKATFYGKTVYDLLARLQDKFKQISLANFNGTTFYFDNGDNRFVALSKYTNIEILNSLEIHIEDNRVHICFYLAKDSSLEAYLDKNGNIAFPGVTQSLQALNDKSVSDRFLAEIPKDELTIFILSILLNELKFATERIPLDSDTTKPAIRILTLTKLVGLRFNTRYSACRYLFNFEPGATTFEANNTIVDRDGNRIKDPNTIFAMLDNGNYFRRTVQAGVEGEYTLTPISIEEIKSLVQQQGPSVIDTIGRIVLSHRVRRSDIEVASVNAQDLETMIIDFIKARYLRAYGRDVPADILNRTIAKIKEQLGAGGTFPHLILSDYISCGLTFADKFVPIITFFNSWRPLLNDVSTSSPEVIQERLKGKGDHDFILLNIQAIFGGTG